MTGYGNFANKNRPLLPKLIRVLSFHIPFRGPRNQSTTARMLPQTYPMPNLGGCRSNPIGAGTLKSPARMLRHVADSYKVVNQAPDTTAQADRTLDHTTPIEDSIFVDRIGYFGHCLNDHYSLHSKSVCLPVTAKTSPSHRHA